MGTLTAKSHILLIFCLAVVFSSYAKQTEDEIRAEASYEKLCKIYGEVKNQMPRSDERADLLGARLRIEVPELDEVESHIVNADPKNVYGLYKQAAEYAIGKPWECRAIKEYYQIK